MNNASVAIEASCKANVLLGGKGLRGMLLHKIFKFETH